MQLITLTHAVLLLAAMGEAASTTAQPPYQTTDLSSAWYTAPALDSEVGLLVDDLVSMVEEAKSIAAKLNSSRPTITYTLSSQSTSSHSTKSSSILSTTSAHTRSTSASTASAFTSFPMSSSIPVSGSGASSGIPRPTGNSTTSAAVGTAPQSNISTTPGTPTPTPSSSSSQSASPAQSTHSGATRRESGLFFVTFVAGVLAAFHLYL